MEFKTEREWVTVHDEMISEDYTKRRTIPFLIVFLASIIAWIIVIYYESYLMYISGHTITDFTIGIVWDIALIIVFSAIPMLIAKSRLEGCPDKDTDIFFAGMMGIGILVTIHGIAHGIWFAVQVDGAGGYLRTILFLESLVYFLSAVMATCCWLVLWVIIKKSERECDAILNGNPLPTQYYNGDGINAKIRCRKKGSTVVCEIPRISSFEN